MSYQEEVSREKLQRLQDEFCRIMRVHACCMDQNMGKLTDFNGSKQEAARLELLFRQEVMNNILSRVEEGSIEDQAIEELEEGRAAAIAVRMDGETKLYWLVLDTNSMQPDRFYQVLDLLQEASRAVLTDRLPEQGRENGTGLDSGSLKALRAITEIIQLLDGKEQTEVIIVKWLEILAKHIQVDTAQVFQLHDDTMDVVCEWRAAGQASFFDRTSNVPAYGFLRTAKPLILSRKCMAAGDRTAEYFKQVREIGMKSVILFPILPEENMVLSLNHRKEEHKWSDQETAFITNAVRILQSVLTRQIQNSSIASSYEVLKTILDNMGCSVYLMKKGSGEFVFANKEMQITFAEELKAGTLAKLITQGRDLDGKNGSYELFHKEKERWYDLTYQQIPWVDGSRIMLYTLYDITDKKLYQKKIERQAYTDFLTGLYNRMCCERDLARMIDEAKRSGTKGAIIYLDLDDFKHINDGLGHQYGDALLKSISHSLQSIQGIQNTCYRMGGDEFVIMIPPDSYTGLEQILDDIKQVFNKPWYLKDADYYCTSSMGIVTFPDAGETVSELIKMADIAMYEAKKGGKNRMAQYSDGQLSESGRRLDMEKNMRDATADGYREFEIYYQPIIEILAKGKKCVGAEALIRWNSTKLGFISPAEFIPLAEYLGLINPIGNYILEEACKSCKDWNDRGYHDYKVNVNLSIVQLVQPDIVENVADILERTGLNPKNLTLEVTESLAINDMARMQEILNKIKSLGVSLALDDFGTGYSSLNHIREIPLDVIKVDQSFVKDLAEDAYSQSFIKMVAELAQTIGVHICVEGIETIDQYKVLQGMKVKYIQGYYLDRPMPRKLFEAKYVG